MDFNSIKWTKRLRIIFLICGFSWILTITALIFFDFFTPAVILIGLFIVALAIVGILGFQYLRINIEQETLIVRYYSIFAFDRSFSMLEIPVQNLYSVEVRHTLMGLKPEFRVSVKVEEGIADYPWISLSAIPRKVNTRLIAALKNLAISGQ
jgi:hypothetical protein